MHLIFRVACQSGTNPNDQCIQHPQLRRTNAIHPNQDKDEISQESSSEFTSGGENIEISEQLKNVIESSSEDETNAQQPGSRMYAGLAAGSPSIEVNMNINMNIKVSSPVNGAKPFPINVTNQNGNVSNSRSNGNSNPNTPAATLDENINKAHDLASVSRRRSSSNGSSDATAVLSSWPNDNSEVPVSSAQYVNSSKRDPREHDDRSDPHQGSMVTGCQIECEPLTRSATTHLQDTRFDLHQDIHET